MPDHPAVKRLIELWERTQVELHGQYSLQRIKDLHAHAHRISPWRNALVYLLTPLPCLVVVAVIDSFKLEDPSRGVLANYRAWLRIYLCAIVVSVTQLSQLHATVPILPLDARRIMAITIFSSTTAVGSVIGYGFLIGFPVPFVFPMCCPAWSAGLVSSFSFYCGDTLRGNAEVRKDVKNYLIIVVCQMSLLMVYPLYAYAFTAMSSQAQTAFVLVLPCIKIGAKNWISYFLSDLDDMKPDAAPVASVSPTPHREAWQPGTQSASSSDLQIFPQPPAKDNNSSGAAELLGLDAIERLLFVQKTAKVLFMAEYAVLIEYTEVVTPVIYCAYILLMFYLPNREYYPQLVDTSSENLKSNLLNVLLYALIELLSFLAIGWVLRHKLGLTRTHQLTFVLATQWRLVQSKFGLWVMYIVQSYLFHSGADFSFQFKWLSSDANATASSTPTS
ncbi:hypothetical protein PybrP1_006087 [[Pythium] brassicae (nom. inval.)]|nr:hypothetical protein PybrP1_006087 [[Pythium] brassicae (nom. inval.)]